LADAGGPDQIVSLGRPSGDPEAGGAEVAVVGMDLPCAGGQIDYVGPFLYRRFGRCLTAGKRQRESRNRSILAGATRANMAGESPSTGSQACYGNNRRAREPRVCRDARPVRRHGRLILRSGCRNHDDGQDENGDDGRSPYENRPTSSPDPAVGRHDGEVLTQPSCPCPAVPARLLPRYASCAGEDGQVVRLAHIACSWEPPTPGPLPVAGRSTWSLPTPRPAAPESRPGSARVRYLCSAPVSAARTPSTKLVNALTTARSDCSLAMPTGAQASVLSSFSPSIPDQTASNSEPTSGS